MSGRHRRHVRTTPRTRRILAFTAPVAAALVPAAIVVWPGGADEGVTLDPGTASGHVQREESVSRSLADRSPMPELSPTARSELAQTVTPTREATSTPKPTKSPSSPSPTQEPDPEPTIALTKYVGSAAGLNVREGPGTDAEVVTVFAYGAEVGLTGEKDGLWRQILHDGDVLWLSGDYLVDDEPPPLPEPEDEISYAECPSGSSVESGLTPDAIRVHRAVCAQFPEVDSYGGVRSGDGGEHGSGQALDIMLSSSSLGDAIAAWVRENYDELGVSEVIWAQQIWTVERASEGWRWMEDRGSTTANHYDHVHVTVYGDSGG